jgi:hypothetical protein
VRWTGGEDAEAVTEFHIDEFEGAPEPDPVPDETTTPELEEA